MEALGELFLCFSVCEQSVQVVYFDIGCWTADFLLAFCFCGLKIGVDKYAKGCARVGCVNVCLCVCIGGAVKCHSHQDSPPLRLKSFIARAGWCGSS